MTKLKTLIETGGGPDGLYHVSQTASGGQTFDDLRQYDIDADFIGQTTHTTINQMYNDTINFALAPTGDKGTVITGFSISQVGGAYCDSGQNHWNIVQLVKAINWDSEVEIEGLLGCLQGEVPTLLASE